MSQKIKELIEANELVAGCPALALYADQHQDEFYGYLIENRLLTIDVWHELIAAMPIEQQNEFIQRMRKAGMAAEYLNADGTYTYKIMVPLGPKKRGRKPKPKPTDEQVTYQMQMDAWSKRQEQLEMWGPHASAQSWLTHLQNKPKPPRVRLQQTGNVTRVIFRPKPKKENV